MSCQPHRVTEKGKGERKRGAGEKGGKEGEC